MNNNNACQQQPQKVSVECVHRTVTNVECSTRHDETNSPDSRGRQCDPSEFGLTGNEEWRHPRMFRDMTYETDAEALEAFRQAQPRRPGYGPPQAPNLSGLPEECLADMSAPAFDMSMASNMSSGCNEYLGNISAPASMYPGVSGHESSQQHLEDVSAPSFLDESMGRGNASANRTDEYLTDVTQPSMMRCQTPGRDARSEYPVTGDEASSYVDSVYREIVDRLSNLRERIARGDKIYPSEIGNYSSIRVPSMPPDASPKNGGVHTTRRHVVMRRDTSGNITSHVEETSTMSNPPYEKLTDVQPPSGFNGTERDCTPAAVSSGRQPRRLNFSNGMENLNDMTMPSCPDDSMPLGMSTRMGGLHGQSMPSECLADVSAPSSFGHSGAGRPNMMQTSPRQNLNDISAPTFASSAYTTSANNECLDDMTMPSFGGVSGAGRSDGICSYADSNKTVQYLDDLTMPSFGNVSGASRAANSARRQQRSPHSQNICDSWSPTYGNVSRSPRHRSNRSRRQQRSSPHANLRDISAPTFASGTHANNYSHDYSLPSHPNVSNMSGAKRINGRRRYRTQDICDISAPSFASSPGARSECLDNITMPSFGNVSGSSRRQQTMPSECLDDVSAPAFGMSASSTRRTPMSSRQQNICDVSAPTFASSGRGLTNSECLNDVTMPSLGNVSGASRRQQQHSMPSECLDDISAPSFGRSGRSGRSMSPARQNICDVSAPTFASSGRGAMTNECLNDITMPSFGQVSGASRRRNLCRTQQRSLPSQNICDISAPSFATNSGRAQECLDDVTMPSYGNVTSGSRRRHPYSSYQHSEDLENLSAPSFAHSMSRSRSLGRQPQQRTLPSQNICDVSAPSFASSGRPLTNECLDDVTMPSFANVSGSSRRQYTMPSECLDDMSAPSFGQTMSRGASSRRRQRTLPSQNICDVSAPSFATSGRGPMTNECLDNVTMPSFGNVSGVSQRRSPGRQQFSSLPAQNICDISAPSFGSSGRSPIKTECYDDRAMPSYGNVPDRRPHTVPNECLDDVSTSSFGRAGPASRGPMGPMLPGHQNICDILAPPMSSSARDSMRNECLEDVTMPSYANVSGISRDHSPYRTPQRSEHLENVSAPSFAQSLPQNQSSRQQMQQRLMSSRNICDESAPSFASSGRTARTNECLEDVTMPSFGNVSGSSRRQQAMPYTSTARSALTNECLDDVTMPSYCNSLGASLPRRPIRRQQRWTPTPNAQMSSYDYPGSGPMTSECLDDMTMPGMDSTPRSPSKRHVTLPSECLDNVSAPSFGANLSRSRSPCRQPLEQICNISAPAFPNSVPTSHQMSDECLNDVTMPSFADVSGSSRRAQPPQHSMPNGFLDDESPPSFVCNYSRSRSPCSMPGEYLDDVSAPSFRSPPQRSFGLRRQRSAPSYLNNSCQNYEILNEMTPPSCGMSSQYDSTLNRSRQPITNECLANVSMPSMQSSGASPRRGQSFPCIPSQHRLNDLSGPSEHLDNITMPSYADDCLDSRRAPQRGYTVSYASENLCDVSPPSFGSAGRHGDRSPPSRCKCVNSRLRSPGQQQSVGSGRTGRPGEPDNITNGLLDDVTMPSYNDISCTPRRHQLTMPSEALDDVTAPSMASHNFLNGHSTLSNTDRTQPSEHLNDVTQPTFQSDYGSPVVPLNRSPYPNENLADETQPSYASTQNTTRSRRLPSPFDFLPNRAHSPDGRAHFAPQYNRVDGPTENIVNTSEPTFYTPASSASNSGLARQPSTMMARIDDITQPTLDDGIDEPKTASSLHHVSSEITTTRRVSKQHTAENLGDISAPSGLNESPPGSTVVDEMEEIHVKSSVTSVTHIYTNPALDNQGQNIEDISMPQFASTGIGSSTVMEANGRNNMAMSQFDGASRSAPRDPYSGMTQDRLEDISMPQLDSTCIDPSRRKNMFLSNITEPSYPRTFESTCQPNNTYHGFSSMENYAPFDELVRSPTGHAQSTGIGNLICTPDPCNNETCSACEGIPPLRQVGQPCDMVSTSYPYGRPHCLPRDRSPSC